MTKRFVHIEHKGEDYILDSPNWDLDFIEMLGDSLEPKELVGLLNHLHQENSILNKNEDDLKECTIENIKLKEENEQLKQEIKQYWKCRDKWKQEAKELKKGNRELRHELDSLTGCYCADNKEFKDYWRIGYDD